MGLCQFFKHDYCGVQNMSSKLGCALVTGASSGIGADFASELAHRGYDLILSARRQDRLEELKEELTTRFSIHVEVLVADLGNPAGAQQLFDQIRVLSLPVKLLVNNAGLGRFGAFNSQTLLEIQEMIQVNLTSLTTLTRLFADQMAQAGGGYILNVASFSAIQPTPDYAVYSGTKAYVLAFSQSLNHGLRSRHVRVCALCPGFFDSEFLSVAGQKLTFMLRILMLNRRSVARAGIAGVLRGRTLVVPGIFYKSLNLLLRLATRDFATALADFAVKH